MKITAATTIELLNESSKVMLSQGVGTNFSRKLENKLIAINKELDKRKFNAFLLKDDDYFSEGHLSAWFDKMYKGKTRAEIKFQLETQHDNSLEFENCESEVERELTEKEKQKIEKRFYKAIYKAIVWKRGIAMAWIDSIGNIN